MTPKTPKGRARKLITEDGRKDFGSDIRKDWNEEKKRINKERKKAKESGGFF